MSGSTTAGSRALDAYEALADAYAAAAPTKPHNAHYDRPATLSLLPNLKGARVLDAGCGPGIYAEAALERGAAEVLSFDVSPRMLEHAADRLARFGARSRRVRATLEGRLPADDGWADVALAPLCLDYVPDWDAVFAEFARVLRPGGCAVVSAGHPAFEADYFGTERYFEVEPVEAAWTGFGVDLTMPSYRRPLEAFLMAPIRAGLAIDRIVEPRPTDAFREADPRRHAQLMRRPSFLMMRAAKPATGAAVKETAAAEDDS